MMRLLVVNGPNLDLLGRREPEVYGSETLDDLEATIMKWARGMGVGAECIQSNDESSIIDSIHDFEGDGIVINPGALTHTSHAIADAIRGVDTPVVEIHISNIREREPWRAVSVISPACARTIYGRGIAGYRDAIRHLVNRLAIPFETVRYGPHADNVADMRRGGDGIDTLALFAHGGLWQHRYEKDTVESLAVDLTRRGYDTLNVEYRRLGDGGGWPGSGHDLLTALDHVPQLGEYGRVIAVSHSAGGQLTAWAAERASTKIGLHVAMSPLLDLEAAVANGDVGASECRTLLQRGAPAKTLPSRVSTVVVHAADDEIVPVERSRAISEATGIELMIPEARHFDLLDPTKPHWAPVLELIEGST